MKSGGASNRDQYKVRYGDEEIRFVLLRRDRKTMSITVHPDLLVEVVAPLDAGLEGILKKVGRRCRWILRQQRQFLAWMPKPRQREYRGGETHRYLGRQYRLKVIAAEEASVKLRGAFLEVRVPDTSDREKVKKAVDVWYRQHAKVRFTEQLRDSFSHLRAYELPEPRLRLLQMEKRWGSCTLTGEIILNPELVKAPASCIEYVVVHELCHLRHPNHSRAFFKMLDAVLPDWQQRKGRLERVEV